MSLETFNVIRMLAFSAIAAVISFAIAPFLIKFLHKIKFWKKEARLKAISGEVAAVFNSLHKVRETTVPRGGGILIWTSAAIVALLFWALSFSPDPWWVKILNFLSRKETWLPFFTLIAGSLVGLVDDISTVYGKGKYIGGGISFWRRMAIICLIGLIGGLWFYYKLDWTTMHIPLLFNFPEGIDIFIGWFYIPLFAAVMLAAWAGGVVDGLDGLAGGTFASIFGAFAIIAFAQGKADLATFCAIICGTLFAFLWFNIPPARFYMGETGILGLTSTMTVVAFLTDSVVVLPVIAGLLVLEAGSVIVQLLSKKFRKKKIWQSTPIHHHFEAVGWTPCQITMRFWILGVVLAALGAAIRLVG
jgi:phospho-N-acetylmuramoyl-pentapeptide-transferase